MNRATAFAVASVGLLLVAAGSAAWLLSGPGPAAVGKGAEDAVVDPCAPRHASLLGQAPNLALAAAGDTLEQGMRSLRWDLVVRDACQEPASAAIGLAFGQVPGDCGAPAIRASVTSGLAETPVALEGFDLRGGAASFLPARVDLAAGQATFVVSLAITLPSQGFVAHDNACIDAMLRSFTLEADYQGVA